MAGIAGYSCVGTGACPDRNTTGVCTWASNVPESQHGGGEASVVQGTCKAARQPDTRHRLYSVRTGHRRVATGWLDGQHKQAWRQLGRCKVWKKKAGTRSSWLLHKMSSRLCACEGAAMDKAVRALAFHRKQSIQFPRLDGRPTQADKHGKKGRLGAASHQRARGRSRCGRMGCGHGEGKQVGLTSRYSSRTV